MRCLSCYEFIPLLKKIIGIAIKITSITSILSMLVIVGLFIWVMLAPRTVFFVTPYLEKELSSINTKYKVKIDDSIIKWDNQQRSIGIYSSNVKVLNDTNDIVASFPEISFGFSLLHFLRGQLLSSDLTIIEPSIYVNTASKTLYVTPDNTSQVDKAIFNAIHATLSSDADSFKIQSIRVKDAKIFLSTDKIDMLWKIDEGYAKLEKTKGKKKIKSEFKINFGKDSTYFEINSAIAPDNAINTEIHFKDLPSYTIDDIFPDHRIEQQVNMYFTGYSSLLVSDAGAISGGQLHIDSANGSINLPAHLKEKVAIKNLKIDARLYDNLSRLAIDNMELDLHGPSLKVSGSIDNKASWPDFSPSFELDAKILNLEAADLENYWPYSFGEIAREWVTHNIKDGIVREATGKFKFSATDIANIITREKSTEKADVPPIPDDAIDATINIEKAKVHYMEHYPPANDVKAIVKFTGKSMDASVASAKILNSNITKAHVKFDNLWEQHLKIGITGNFDGDAQNLVQFLKLSYMEKPDNKNMASIYNMSGHASGNIFLSIPIISGLKYDDIDIIIASNFKNTLLPDFINGKNIVASNLDFMLDKYDINVKGDSVINNIPATINFHKNFSDSSIDDMQINIKGMFSPVDIKELGITTIPLVTGKMGLDVNVNIKNDSITVAGLANLMQSSVIIESLGFEKPAEKNGKIAFNIVKSGKENIDIKDFKLEGDGFSINGSAKVDSTLSGLSELSLKTAKFGVSDFTANYKSSETTSNIVISGKSLDISKSKISNWFRPDNDKIKKSLSMDINLDRLYMKNSEVLREFVSNVSCAALICNSGNLYGKIRDSNFVAVNLKNLGNRSSLVVESDNAGALIKALNISKNITGGHLNIDSTLARVGGTTVAQGAIKMFDFTAVKTPILGKILTLASFRGFEDLLNNQGISFNKFEAPFTMANGVITVKDAKSSGSSIGITAEGTIDTLHDDVDLKGVIVPAYAVNNVIGQIPVVGKIIIGKKNEGIIATKYSIKGSYDDAKVNVNTLSILAPGFIRNIFDIFD